MPEARQLHLSLAHAEALYRWCRFTDSALGGVDAPVEVLMDALVSAGATEGRLMKLWREVKDLAWVSPFGESPWKAAGTLAAALKARELGQEAAGSAEHYVSAFHAAVEKRRRQAMRSCGILRPYRVMLFEKRGERLKLAFDCVAEDPDDAAEQAELAFPACEVISCTSYDERAMPSRPTPMPRQQGRHHP